MTPKNRIIEGKKRIKGGRGVKKDQKNQTSFMHDPQGIIFFFFLFVIKITFNKLSFNY